MSHAKSEEIITLSNTISIKINEALHSIEGTDRKGIQKKIKKASRKIARRLLKPASSQPSQTEVTGSDKVSKRQGPQSRKPGRKSISNPQLLTPKSNKDAQDKKDGMNHPVPETADHSEKANGKKKS